MGSQYTHGKNALVLLQLQIKLTCFKKKRHIGFIQFLLQMDLEFSIILEILMELYQQLELKDGLKCSTRRLKMEENGELGLVIFKSDVISLIMKFSILQPLEESVIWHHNGNHKLYKN